MARTPINRWLMLGVALGIVGVVLGSWLVARIDNWALSVAWSLLVLAIVLQPLYQRWSRRRRSQRAA